MAEAGGDHNEAVTDGRERAIDVLGSLRDAADTLIEEQKARMAETVRGFAHALRRSAHAFAAEEGGGTTIARAAGQIAAQVEEFSDTIGRRPWRTVLADLEDGARARPDLFFAGALAAGFLMGRLIAGAAVRPEAEP